MHSWRISDVPRGDVPFFERSMLTSVYVKLLHSRALIFHAGPSDRPGFFLFVSLFVIRNPDGND